MQYNEPQGMHRPMDMRAAAGATALEGIRMLQGGCAALKYGRAGKPHLTDFRLNQDRTVLSWSAKRSSLTVKSSHSVELRLVNHLLVGRESSVFKRFQDGGRTRSRSLGGGNWGDMDVMEDQQEAQAEKRAPGKEHLSLSLQFGWAPQSKGEKQRDTLDVSFEDEETFGYWVAAIRALVPAHALGHDIRGVRDDRDRGTSQPARHQPAPPPPRPAPPPPRPAPTAPSQNLFDAPLAPALGSSGGLSGNPFASPLDANPFDTFGTPPTPSTNPMMGPAIITSARPAAALGAHPAMPGAPMGGGFGMGGGGFGMGGGGFAPAPPQAAPNPWGGMGGPPAGGGFGYGGGAGMGMGNIGMGMGMGGGGMGMGQPMGMGGMGQPMGMGSMPGASIQQPPASNYPAPSNDPFRDL